MKTVCACPVCRRMIRDQIFLAFDLRPRWMGEFTIRDVAMLSWVPCPLYQHILGRMCLLGQLIKSVPSDPNQPTRYLSSRLVTPVRAPAASKRKGTHHE